MTRAAASSICASILLAACAATPAQDDAPDVDAGPEPTPEFRIFQAHGALAIDDDGIRETYVVGGLTRRSSLNLTLYIDDGFSGTCEVNVQPALVGFAQRSTPTHEFQIVQLDPGQGVLGDGCGWDDDHVQAELAALGPLEIGFARPAVAENWPSLDVLYDYGAGASPVVYSWAGRAWAMDADGTVLDERLSLALPTFERGLYEF